MKYLKKYESPDYIDEKGLDFQDGDAVAFTTTRNKRKGVVDTERGRMHSDMYFDFEREGVLVSTSRNYIFSGRLWLEHHIISFWYTPDTKEKLDKFLKDIDQDLRDKGHLRENETIFDGTWYVENYIDSENEEGVGNFDTEYDEPYLIPLKDFTGQEFSEEHYNVHLMNAKEKELYYKKHGKPTGFGSTLKANKNPLKWEQAKRTSESYVKTFENYNHECIIDKIKVELMNEHDCGWDTFIDNQELGDCQSIVSSIEHMKIEGVETHFGEIRVEFPIDEDYDGKIMTHHWCSYEGKVLEFSKGTLENYVDWGDKYDPTDDGEIEYINEIETRL